MSETWRHMAHYLREAAGLTSVQFLRLHDHPVLLWPQGDDWTEQIGYQFETSVIEPQGYQTFEVPQPHQSKVRDTLIIEVRKRSGAAPTQMICVGRATNNDIIFADNTVSKLHAYFLKAAGSDSFHLVDANSTNGTKVNRRRLVPNQTHALENRDRIHFGPTIRVMYLTGLGFFEMLQQFHRAGIM